MTTTSVRNYKWFLVAGIVIFVTLLAYSQSHTFSSIFMETRNSLSEPECQNCAASRYTSQLTLPPIPLLDRHSQVPLYNTTYRCRVPGLQSIEQYRHYLHNTETTCSKLQPFGGKPPAPDAGRKMVCLDDRFNIQPGNCVVFSFGVGNEWSFEDDFDKFGCRVYAYDPTMGKKDHQRSRNIKFFATGISSYKGTMNVGMGKKWSVQKVDRFENLVRDVGEEGREIDFVKLDVELAEIDFLQDMLFNSPHVLARIKQIAMEVHDGPFKGDLSQTSRHQVFWPYFMLMRCAGFELIHTRETWGWREVVWARSY